MKMRMLLLLKCVCVCVHQFSKVSLHALSPKTLCYLHMYLPTFVSGLILPFIPHFAFRFPLKVEMFLCFFDFLALAIPCSHVV